MTVQQLEDVPFALTRSIVYPTATGSADFVGVADFVAIGVAIAGAAGAAVAAVVAEALGAFFTATPLFQTNLPLFLTQVNLRPDTVEDCPAFLHDAPALAAAEAGGAITRAKATAAPVAIA
jgi:hypothetical protein